VRLPFCEQCLQIGFKACQVLAGMLEQEFDEAPFSSPEMPVHAAARQSMQHGDGLLGEKSFKFVGIHMTLVTRQSSTVNR
jgi:hypothetical protein